MKRRAEEYRREVTAVCDAGRAARARMDAIHADALADDQYRTLELAVRDAAHAAALAEDARRTYEAATVIT